MHKWIKVFEAGKRIDSSGVEREFSDADIADIATYNPSIHAAPLLIQHDETRQVGRTAETKLQGNSLYARFERVLPKLKDQVGSWLSLKPSVGLYAPTDPKNPTPGKWSLREISGVSIPAVKGLPDLSFAESKDGVIINFMEGSMAPMEMSDTYLAQFIRNMREWLIAEKGVDVADRIAPNWMVDTLSVEAADKTEEESVPEYTEVSTSKTNMTKELEQREAALIVREQALLRSEKIAFAEGLVAKGLPPLQKDRVVELLMHIDKPDSTVKFGEQDIAPAKLFEELLDAVLIPVTYGELVTGEEPQGAKPVNFSAPPGLEVDSESLAVHSKAIAYQAAHPGTEYLTAVYAVGGK